jgi:hypothetical protein
MKWLKKAVVWLWTETLGNVGRVIAAAVAALILGLVPFPVVWAWLKAESTWPNWLLSILLLIALAALFFISRGAIDRWKARRFSLLITDEKLGLLWRIHRPIEQWVGINLKNASQATIDLIIDGPYDSINECYAPISVGVQNVASVCTSCGRKVAIASVTPRKESHRLTSFPIAEGANFPVVLMKKCILIALQQRYLRGQRIKSGLRISDVPYPSVFQ